jgi:hypothetical protein
MDLLKICQDFETTPLHELIRSSGEARKIYQDVNQYQQG